MVSLIDSGSLSRWRSTAKLRHALASAATAPGGGFAHLAEKALLVEETGAPLLEVVDSQRRERRFAERSVSDETLELASGVGPRLP